MCLGRVERRNTEAEGLAQFDVEACALQRRERVPAEVAAAGQVWPHRGVGKLLHTTPERAWGRDVLHEAQLTVRSENVAQLAHSGIDIANRAQHERADDEVEGRIVERQPLRGGVDNAHVCSRACRDVHQQPTEIRLGFDDDQVLDCRRVVPQVDPCASADLEDSTGDPIEEVTAALPQAQLLPALDLSGVEARAQGMTHRRRCRSRSRPRRDRAAPAGDREMEGATHGASITTVVVACQAV